MRPFNLLRYFTVASLGVIAALSLATAWTFSRNLEHSMVDEAGAYAHDVAVMISVAIEEQLLEPLARDGVALDLEDPAQRLTLERIVSERMRGLRIMTLNLFDAHDTIVWSTRPELVGIRELDDPELEEARDGHSTSILRRAGHGDGDEGEHDPRHDLLETYVPFGGLARHGGAIAVIELYQDARPITREIRDGERRIALATVGLMTLLFAALFEIVRRGHARIAHLTMALALSNRELEGRVVERTHQLESGRERLRALLDGIADGISVVARDFSVREANLGIERLFGREPAGSTRPCHERYAGRATPCSGCPARATLESRAPARRRYRWPNADGGVREVEVSTFPFTTESQEPAVIELVRDVSERGELERQLAQSESLAALGQLAAGVAHEVRNPIGMISSSAQLLAQTAGLAERERRLVEVIRAEASRVNATVTEFVGFAAPPKASLVATDSSALLSRAQTMLGVEAERRGIEFVVSRPEQAPPKILVDPELMYRALANLILNALQVQGAGGQVRLSCARADGGEVALYVDDRGPGIAEGDLAHLFEPFFSRRSGGTGLGLSIVQRLVTANGGRIEVTSSPSGTRFALLFAEDSP